MRELLLDMDSSLGKRHRLESALRAAVQSGQLVAGTSLPSSRALAEQLGFSRATVVSAYEQLTAEGFLLSERGSSTRVGYVHFPASKPSQANLLGPVLKYDFRPGEPDNSCFPRSAWLRSVRRVLVESPDASFGYPDPRGREELRFELAAYLARTRSVRAEAESIHIVGGFAAALGFLGEMFSMVGCGRVAVEDPMLFFHRDILKTTGIDIVPIPVDSDGLCVEQLRKHKVDAVLVTPAHQHPMGVTMSAERRVALVDWARSTDSWIIEDDYDSEFRYDRRPIAAVQSLAPDRVIHGATASKVLAGGLRLAWLTIPEPLRRPFLRVLHIRAGVSSIDQLALADFIAAGELDRHVTGMRKLYRSRRSALADRLRAELDWLELSDVAAGLHLTASIADASIREADVVAMAAANSIDLLGLGPLYAAGVSPGLGGFALGFSRINEHQFPSAVDALMGTLHDAAS